LGATTQVSDTDSHTKIAPQDPVRAHESPTTGWLAQVPQAAFFGRLQ
jgi:hypothetical protein